MSDGRTWTIDEVLAEGPCDPRYTRERLEELFAGRERMSLREIIDHPDVPAEDRVWMCCRDHLHRAAWLERVVTRVVGEHALPHPATREWAERRLSGEYKSEAAARAARAAWSVRAAAEAAWAVEAARAEEAAWAARVARAEEARNEERVRQLDDMRAVLEASDE